MERGTYAAASAGLLALRKLELVNHNLANVNTPGYKAQFLVSQEQEFEDTLARFVEDEAPFARGDHERVSGSIQLNTATDFTQGPIKHTGADLDVALRSANEFFVINTPAGQQYTRGGNFTLNSEGQLTTLDGMIVQGDGGAITSEGAGMKITPGGGVVSNGQEVGRLQVVRFEDPSVLERTSGTRFKLANPADIPQAVDSPSVEPGALEMSNVGAIRSVVSMITATRGFEMYTRTARSIDEMNQTAITRLGKR